MKLYNVNPRDPILLPLVLLSPSNFSLPSFFLSFVCPHSFSPLLCRARSIMPVYNRRKNIYRPPRFGKHHGTEGAAFEHKKVSWLELFVDLIFVWMIAQLSELAMDVALSATHESDPESCKMFTCGKLAYHKCHVVAPSSNASTHGRRLGGEGAAAPAHPFGMTEPQALGLSFCIYILYAWRVWLTEVHIRGRFYDGEDGAGRIMTMVTVFGMGGMACAAAYGVSVVYDFFTFRGSYVVARSMQMCFLVRLLWAHENLPGADGKRDGGRHGIKLCVWSGAVEVAMVVLSIVLSLASSAEAGILCFLASYAFSVLSMPVLGLFSKLGYCTARSYTVMSGIPAVHPEHYAERLGLMVIIVLGEAAAHGLSVAKEAMSFGPNHAGSARARYGANGMALVTIFVQFWLYFDTINEDIFDGKHMLEAAVVNICHLLVLVGFSTLSSAIGMLGRSFLCETDSVPLPSAVAWFACIAGGVALGSSAWIRVFSVRRTLLDNGRPRPKMMGMLHLGTAGMSFGIMLMPLWAEQTALSVLLTLALVSLGLLFLDSALGFCLQGNARQQQRQHPGASKDSVRLRNSWAPEGEEDDGSRGGTASA